MSVFVKYGIKKPHEIISAAFYLLKTFSFRCFLFVEGLKVLKRSYRHEFMKDKSCFMDQETGDFRKADNKHLKQTIRVLIIRRNGYEKNIWRKLKTDIQVQRHLESSADSRIVQQTLKSNYDNAVSCLSDILFLLLLLFLCHCTEDCARQLPSSQWSKFIYEFLLVRFEKLILNAFCSLLH